MSDQREAVEMLDPDTLAEMQRCATSITEAFHRGDEPDAQEVSWLASYVPVLIGAVQAPLGTATGALRCRCTGEAGDSPHCPAHPSCDYCGEPFKWSGPMTDGAWYCSAECRAEAEGSYE